jgi:hypothetical protein
MIGRRTCGESATAARALGWNFAANAPSVRAMMNSPFSVSPGRRPHFRQRSSSWFRDPQKPHVITAHLLPPRQQPDVLTLAFYALSAKLPPIS